jgi:hypothetical protein
MIRNTKSNEIRKQLSVGIISKIDATRKVRASRCLKMNELKIRKKFDNFKSESFIRRVSRLLLKTPKKGNLY